MLACLLLLFSGAPAISAEMGVAYGERLVRAGQSWPDGLAPRAQPPALPPPADREAYHAALDAELAAGGPYDPELAEPLQGLARSRWAEGDIAGAEELLARALHVVRINDGLSSERQLPLLRDLIDLSRSTGDLAALDDRYGYLYFLNGAGQPPYTEQRVQATLTYLRWQREALRLGVDSGNRAQQRLVSLLDLNGDLLEAVAELPEALPPEQVWSLVRSQLRNLYLLQSAIPSESPFLSVGAGSRYRVLPGDELDAERQRLENLRRSGMGRGRRLLQDFIDTLAPGSPLQWWARLALADWYQWHGSTRRAAALYGELAVELKAAGEEATLSQWFGEPVELPDNGSFWQGATPADEVSGPLPMRFEVTARGRVRNVESPEVAEDMEATAGRIRRELADTRFRPRLVGGEPVASDGLEREYLWLPLRRSRWP